MVILGQETLAKYMFFKNEKADNVMFMNLVKGYFRNKCEDKKKGREIMLV